MALCMLWWLLTPVALPVTSLVGLALLPTLGALDMGAALALFGNQAVFFVIGVFLVAAVMFQTGLSSRLTLLGLRRFARNENVLCTAVMFISWGLCMVMVSHAVAAIMLPIVLELIRALDLGPRSRTARRLLLSMAWGTVAGSNLTLLSSARASLALELYGQWREEAGLAPDSIGFLAYSAGSIPVSLLSLLIAMAALRLAFPPEGIDIAPALTKLDERVASLGEFSGRERTTLLVIAGMIITMVLTGPHWLGVTALLFSGLLFVLQVLSWEDAERYVNWGVALMYGGAIAIGGALHQTGATDWLAQTFIPDAMSAWIALALIGLITAALTEVISNAAVIAVVLPIALPIANQAGLSPHTLVWLVPLAAGFAFVLPTSTPAMAMVFGTGYLRTKDTLVGVGVTAGSLVGLVIMARFLWPLLGLDVAGALP
jgi:anion transporter